MTRAKGKLPAADASHKDRVLLSPRQARWLLAAAVVAFVPLVPHLPYWLSASVALALLLRAWLLQRRQPLPPRWILIGATLAAGLGVLLEYRTLIGQTPGVALLVAFLALKQFESRSRRDGVASVLLCYFLVLTSFFFSQAIVSVLILLAAVWLTTASLGSLTDDRLSPRQLLRNTAWMLLQTLPIVLILFVLFPRASGPLWGLPRDAHSALTGLSDSMSPGAISRLSQSDAIAFRVRFPDARPSREQLYWRGPVLTLFDGYTWRPATVHVAASLPPDTVDATGIAHEITLEPHNKPWLFALQFPVQLPAHAVITSDYQLLARTPVVQRQRYEVRSQPGLPTGVVESPRTLALARMLPPQGNPRIRALGRSWRATHADDAAILRTALTFFVGQNLGYTLSPPLLGNDSVDGFLFETRLGFCEHFAGAFVVALRAANIPARVVTGYQGGEFNPVDGFMTVRQSDAHAWAEVWLPGRGWVQVDPTAASYPRRIEQNLAAVVPTGDPLPLLMRADLSWLRELRYRWDAVANHWNQWVIGYNPQRQRDLLARFGLAADDWRQIAALLGGIGGAALLALAYIVLRQRRRVDAAQALWLKVTTRLARRGLPRQPWEGPLDYAHRIARLRPLLAEEILAISALYADTRYGKLDALASLRTRIAAFKP